MIYSKWICNLYKQDFEIKEKRNDYRERIYYQKILIDIEKEKMKWLKNNKFSCKYEKDYKLI